MEAMKKIEKGVDDYGDDPAEKKEKMMIMVAILVKKENAAHPGERKGKKIVKKGEQKMKSPIYGPSSLLYSKDHNNNNNKIKNFIKKIIPCIRFLCSPISPHIIKNLFE